MRLKLVLQREPKCYLKSVNFHQSSHVRSSKNNLSPELKTKTDSLLEEMAEIPADDKLVSYLTNYPTKCSFKVEGCEKFPMGYSPNSKHDYTLVGGFEKIVEFSTRGGQDRSIFR